MAEEKKDNFFTIVAISAVLSIGLVVMLKGRETEHLKYQSETNASSEAQALSKHKDFNNKLQ